MITPLGNKVLIIPKKEEEKKTEGGLVVIQKEKPFGEGVVAAVSPDIQLPNLKPGNNILYENGAGVSLDDGNLLMNYESVVAVVDL